MFYLLGAQEDHADARGKYVDEGRSGGGKEVRSRTRGRKLKVVEVGGKCCSYLLGREIWVAKFQCSKGRVGFQRRENQERG